MIHAETQTLDLADEDRVETIVAGLRYTGPNSTAPPRRPRDSGGWPGRASFQGGEDGDPGPLQIGVIPDTIDEEYVDGGTLPGLENLPDFEVVYDKSELAKAILRENYLPPTVFGGPRTAPDYAVREHVFDALGLDSALGTADGNEEGIREALADVAGEDPKDDPTTADNARAMEYADNHSRSDLYDACQRLGVDVEWANAKKTEMAEDLATFDPGEVRAAFDGEIDTSDGDE